MENTLTADGWGDRAGPAFLPRLLPAARQVEPSALAARRRASRSIWDTRLTGEQDRQVVPLNLRNLV